MASVSLADCSWRISARWLSVNVSSSVWAADVWSGLRALRSPFGLAGIVGIVGVAVVGEGIGAVVDGVLVGPVVGTVVVGTVVVRAVVTGTVGVVGVPAANAAPA
jgi:hypothetical protein